MSSIRARIQKLNWKVAAKIFILPFVACAVVGAESLTRYSNESVSQQDEGLDETLRSHFVQLDKGNTFSGVITGIDANSGDVTGVSGLKVYLVQKSKVIRESQTGSKGEFSISEIEAGTYSFCVAGKNGFLAYGVHLLDAKDDSSEEAESTDGAEAEKSLEIHTSWVAPTTVTAAVVPPEFNALRQIMSDLLPGSVGNAVGVGADKIRINVEKSIVAGGYKIALDENGTMKGRIAPIGTEKDKPIRLREMNVFLISDDEIYARTSVKENGSFEFKGIEPGVYGFAAAGKDGFAAISFQAVKADTEDKDASLDSEFIFTSAKRERLSNLLAIAICPPEDSDFLKRTIRELSDRVDPVDPVDPTQVPDLPFDGAPLGDAGVPPFGGPGGFDTPAFPGGGGGGGFPPRPGFGRLLRLGALGGLIWAIIELADDDDNLNTPTPVSPVG